MRSLFDAGRHERLLEIAWDESAANDAIARIVRDTQDAFSVNGLWPLHTQDAEDGEIGPHTGLYFGAAGVIWALDHLQREDAVAPGPTFATQLDVLLLRNREALQSDAWRRALGSGWQTRSWLFGDAGVLWVNEKIRSTAATLSALAGVIDENIHDPSCDLMWGNAGTLLPALAVFRRSGDDVWRHRFLAGVDALTTTLVTSNPGVHLWTQCLYGAEIQYLGLVHGFAGNAKAIWSGKDLLEPSRRAALARRFAETLRATARWDDLGGVNWPAYHGQAYEKALLIQVCHGAPAMIIAFSDLEADIDDLLRGAGELIWRAGPLRKGAGLCHGTAGNGLALLRLFERSGDEVWLWRARRFAMHALAQADEEANQAGQRRYSLWTGDLGLACFMWECIRASARFPTLDHL